MKSTIAIILCFLEIQIIATEQNPAFYAVQQNDTKTLKKSLKVNVYNPALNSEGQTILHVAALSNNIQAVKTILKSGFTCINKFDKYGKTAMDYAVEYGYDKIVRKLYKNHGKVTSVENANYAKSLITHSFKGLFFSAISFFIGAALVISISLAVLCFSGSMPCFDIILGTSFSIFSTGLLFLSISKSGWASRAGHNLLLPRSAQPINN